MQNRKTLTICINMGSVSAGLSDKFLLNLIKFFRFLGGQHAPEYPAGLDVPYTTAKEVGELLFTDSLPEFLNDDAKECFESIQLQHKRLNWDNDTWLVVKNFNNITIWSFAGEKINRTLVKLIESNEFGKASANYKSVEIKPKDKESQVNINGLLDFIKNLKTESCNDYYKMLENSVNPLPFTKFARCMPEELIKKTLAERSFDLAGLIAELKNKKIKINNFTKD